MQGVLSKRVAIQCIIVQPGQQLSREASTVIGGRGQRPQGVQGLAIKVVGRTPVQRLQFLMGIARKQDPANTRRLR